MQNIFNMTAEVFDHITGLYIWKKDIQGNFTYMNGCFAELVGFKMPSIGNGKNDHDLPTKLARFANIFRDADNMVMTQKRPLKFLEIQPYANENWKTLYVIKFPLSIDNHIRGTLGIGIDITKVVVEHNYFTHLTKQSDKPNQFDQITRKSNQLLLSSRQLECLSLLNTGKTVKEIAKIINLSPRTVEYHINNIKMKFGCRNIKQLISHCFTLNITSLSFLNILQKQVSILIE